jgi:hypothetical protein
LAAAARNERHTPIWAAVAIAALAIIDAMAHANVETIGALKPPAREWNAPRKFVAKLMRARSN